MATPESSNLSTHTHTPKVAIVYSGLLRSLQYTLPNIETNIYQQLKKAGYSYDIYCHNYTFPENHVYNNYRSNEVSIKLDPELYKHLNADYYISADQIETMKQLDLPKYRSQGDPWPKTQFAQLDYYLLAMYSRSLITTLLETNIATDPVKYNYDYVIFMRSDVIFEKPVNFKAMFNYILAPDHCLIPNFQHWLNGLNDRMFIGRPALAIKYGKSFSQLLEISTHRKLHSEQINKHLLIDKYNAKLVLVPIFFSRVRATGQIVKESFEP